MNESHLRVQRSSVHTTIIVTKLWSPPVVETAPIIVIRRECVNRLATKGTNNTMSIITIEKDFLICSRPDYRISYIRPYGWYENVKTKSSTTEYPQVLLSNNPHLNQYQLLV